jgi:hypothetical protein
MIERKYPISDAMYVDYGFMVWRDQKLSVEMKHLSPTSARKQSLIPASFQT